MTFYIGILDGSGDVWGVRIPDCPGAYGAGESAELAVASAIKGLTAWAGAAVKDGAKLPNPRCLAKILASGEIEAGETMVLVPLLLKFGPDDPGQHHIRCGPARCDRCRGGPTWAHPVRLSSKRGPREDRSAKVKAIPNWRLLHRCQRDAGLLRQT